MRVALLKLPNEVTEIVVQELHPNDVDSLGRTCKEMLAFVSDSSLIESYLRRNALLAPLGRTLDASSNPPITSLERMGERLRTLDARAARHLGIASVRAGLLLGLGAEMLVPSLSGGIHATGLRARASMSSPSRPPPFDTNVSVERGNDGRAQTMRFAYAGGASSVAAEPVTKTMYSVTFPQGVYASNNCTQAFAVYRAQDLMFVLCADGDDCNVHVTRDPQQSSSQVVELLSPRSTPLTSYGMSPIYWKNTACAVLCYARGELQLWRL